MSPSQLIVGCPTKESYVIYVSSYFEADEMVANSVQWLAAQAAAFGLKDAKIYYLLPSGKYCSDDKAFVVPALFTRGKYQQASLNQEFAEVASNLGIKPGLPNIAEPIIKTVTDFDWNAVMQGENPTYISQMRSQANLFVSAAAVAAQSDKPPSDLLSDTAHSLNYEDELLYRCKTVVADGAIAQYQYEGLRWFNEDGMWIRRRMNFVSNVWNIQYLNRECWMEEVLFATPV